MCELCNYSTKPKIYVIDKKDQANIVRKRLGRVCHVVGLGCEKPKIEHYSQLFEDISRKIIALSPGAVEWRFPKEVMRKIPNLLGISTLSAWAFYLDLKYCKTNNISVTNTPQANSQSVAEYAIWMMMSLARQLPRQLREDMKPAFDEGHVQTEITGKTMGIVGLGNIGSRIAKMGQGLGMKVIYWSRSKKDVPYKSMSLEKVLSEAHYVFNCLETCEGTMGLLNKTKLKLMKKSACFISVLGGAGWGVEDDDYLIEMVEKGRLAGLSFEGEHKKEYKIKENLKGNIFIPAAYAWYTKEALDRMNEMWIEGMEGIIEGRKKYRAV